MQDRFRGGQAVPWWHCAAAGSSGGRALALADVLKPALALTSRLRSAAEQLAHPTARCESHFRLGPRRRGVTPTILTALGRWLLDRATKLPRDASPSQFVHPSGSFLFPPPPLPL